MPRFLQGSGRGWVTAEYSMLPGATDRRSEREATRGRPSGRTQEIQRLIGRSLRAVVDLAALGERTLWVDCDVLQADGGTRCASITGASTALAIARGAPAPRAARSRAIRCATRSPRSRSGIVDGALVLDLAYDEDARAEVDMNVVATGRGRFVEVQGTAEGATFSRDELDALTRSRWRHRQLARILHAALQERRSSARREARRASGSRRVAWSSSA